MLVGPIKIGIFSAPFMEIVIFAQYLVNPMQKDKIFATQDGSHSILSHKFGVSYHSKYGAITESKHVFITSGLYPILTLKKSCKVLEIGFGTGLNAFLTFLETIEGNFDIHYQGIEAFPLSSDQYLQLNYPELLEVPAYKDQFLKLHEAEWGIMHRLSEHFTFKKEQILLETFKANEPFDVIYFDAFAPTAQPELWEAPILQQMYEALQTEGIFVTYCAKGIVKRRLKAIGFEVETLPGPPGKREMTRGIKK